MTKIEALLQKKEKRMLIQTRVPMSMKLKVQELAAKHDTSEAKIVESSLVLFLSHIRERK